jgi:hypothetical protein
MPWNGYCYSSISPGISGHTTNIPKERSAAMYTRYFSPGQKILLRSINADLENPRVEAVTARVLNYDAGCFDLVLTHPWQTDEPFFAEGRPLEFLSERFGLGLQSTAHLQSLSDGRILRLRANNDLSLFRPRPKPRIETHIGLQHSASGGSLNTYYRHWTRQLAKMASSAAPLNVPILPLGPVNLSASGIRLTMKTPVSPNDLCLMMLELATDEMPICTLGEVVWMTPTPDEQRKIVGMQFLNILREDQERIDHFIKTARETARRDKKRE